MSDSFYLKILAMNKVLYEGKAQSLIFPAPDGEFQIMAHHENVVVACNEGTARIKTEDTGEWIDAVVGAGLVNVDNGIVTLLVDSAEWPGDLEKARALEAMERAKEELRQDSSIQEYNATRATLARAMVRLSKPMNAPLE